MGSGNQQLLVLASTFPRREGDHEPSFVYELAKRLAPRWKVHVLVPHARGLAGYEEMGGIQVHRFRYAPAALENLCYEGGMLARLRQNPLRYLLIPLFLAAQFVTARRLLRKYSISVVHAHWLLPQGIVAIMLKHGLRNPPVVLVTSHGGDLFSLRGRIPQALKKQVLKRSDFVTVVSDAMRKEAIEIGGDPKRIEVIPMGVDLESRFTPDEGMREPDTVVFVGRLVPKKGLTHLLQAFADIVAVNSRAKLLIAGAGPEEEALKKQVARLSIEQKVEFLGALENCRLPAIYRRAAIAVFPFVETPDGDQEGFGLVLVEAMGCGCAVIASDMAAVRDVVLDGETGILVAQADSKQLSRAIDKLQRDPELRSRLAEAGRETVMVKFDWKHTASRYDRLLTMLFNRELV